MAAGSPLSSMGLGIGACGLSGSAQFSSASEGDDDPRSPSPMFFMSRFNAERFMSSRLPRACVPDQMHLVTGNFRDPAGQATAPGQETDAGAAAFSPANLIETSTSAATLEHPSLCVSLPSMLI